MRFKVVLAAALAGTIACGGKGKGSPTEPAPTPQPNSNISYTAIGASDAIGFGSSVVCIPFVGCPDGRGYVQVATRDLRSRGFTVELTNLGFPAHVLSRRLQDLGTRYGRAMTGNMVELQAPFVAAGTTLVTIFAGANDVDTIVAALGGGAGGSDQASQIAYIDSQIDAFAQDFAALLNAVRDRAPSARVIVMNVPNMAGIPRDINGALQKRRAQQMLSVGITTKVINPRASSGVLVVDLMCDSRSYQSSSYASDGFHPNDTGYAWIAAEVVAAATTAYRPPASSCAQNVLVQ